jgi:hypothetical protein
MTEISATDQHRLAQAFVAANTAGSLLSWLQDDPTVVRLAMSATETDLLDLLFPLLRTEKRTETDAAVSYALLVALGLQRRTKMGDFSTPFSLATLAWGHEIWRRLSRSYVPTNRIELTISQRPTLQATGSDGGGRTVLLDPNGSPFVRENGR